MDFVVARWPGQARGTRPDVRVPTERDRIFLDHARAAARAHRDGGWTLRERHSGLRRGDVRPAAARKCVRDGSRRRRVDRHAARSLVRHAPRPAVAGTPARAHARCTARFRGDVDVLTNTQGHRVCGDDGPRRGNVYRQLPRCAARAAATGHRIRDSSDDGLRDRCTALHVERPASRAAARRRAWAHVRGPIDLKRHAIGRSAGPSHRHRRRARASNAA